MSKVLPMVSGRQNEHGDNSQLLQESNFLAAVQWGGNQTLLCGMLKFIQNNGYPVQDADQEQGWKKGAIARRRGRTESNHKATDRSQSLPWKARHAQHSRLHLQGKIAGTPGNSGFEEFNALKEFVELARRQSSYPMRRRNLHNR